MTTQTPIPNPSELGIPGGTYTATQTFVQVDRAGQWFATSMSSYGGSHTMASMLLSPIVANTSRQSPRCKVCVITSPTFHEAK